MVSLLTLYLCLPSTRVSPLADFFRPPWTGVVRVNSLDVLLLRGPAVL